jgi:xylulokinase
VLEGVAFALRDALSAMEACGLVAEELRLIGQGAVSDLWAQIVANVLNRPLAVPAEPDASFGAALITAMGVGILPQSAAAAALVRYRTQLLPQAEQVAAYDRVFAIYRDADAALQKIGGRLGAFEQDQAQRS